MIPLSHHQENASFWQGIVEIRLKTQKRVSLASRWLHSTLSAEYPPITIAFPGENIS
jgi:hypothetical protein